MVEERTGKVLQELSEHRQQYAKEHTQTVKERFGGGDSNTKMYDDQKTVVMKNMLDAPLISDGKSNYSFFDEQNSLFVTEKSWSLALNFSQKCSLADIIEHLHEHVTIVTDYVFAYDNPKERAMTEKDRLLSLIKMHSNHFSHINSMKQLDSDGFSPSVYKLTNRKFEKYNIDTDQRKLTHFMNSILLKAYGEQVLAQAVPEVQELIIVLNKQKQIQYFMAFLNQQKVRLSHFDIFKEDTENSQQVLIYAYQTVIAIKALHRNNLALQKIDQNTFYIDHESILKVADLTTIMKVDSQSNQHHDFVASRRSSQVVLESPVGARLNE